ncbi:MAG TPA: SprT family zinc-dependent metalloprotease [Miltoncostaea sp.]|jgi:predicted metal-dependent hydrolase|nr:SprT family zinc-dependent metalloprotease [Miltoncostaea sp.]
MTLRVGPAGVRVTVPARVRAGAVEAFLREHRAWVEQRLAELPAAPPLVEGDTLALLDGTLTLAVVGAPGGGGRAGRRGDRLVVRPDADGGLDAPVERWYRREALRELEPRAHEAAARLGREVTRVSVRDPRSRWGSCTVPGRLSFSWRLMLAPEHVLDHVVAHEACHLVHPDHSPAFWGLLGEVRPGYATSRAWLRQHGERLRLGPAWRSLSPA